MKKIKHLILPILATIVVVIGSGLSAARAKVLMPETLLSQDKFLHLSCYFILTFLWAYGLHRLDVNKAINKSLWITIIVGIIMELCQFLFFEGRLFEILDIIANISGSLIGALVFIKFIK